MQVWTNIIIQHPEYIQTALIENLKLMKDPTTIFLAEINFPSFVLEKWGATISTKSMDDKLITPQSRQFMKENCIEWILLSFVQTVFPSMKFTLATSSKLYRSQYNFTLQFDLSASNWRQVGRHCSIDASPVNHSHWGGDKTAAPCYVGSLYIAIW